MVANQCLLIQYLFEFNLTMTSFSGAAAVAVGTQGGQAAGSLPGAAATGSQPGAAAVVFRRSSSGTAAGCDVIELLLQATSVACCSQPPPQLAAAGEENSSRAC